MAKTPIWKAISDELKAHIAEGRHASGAQLPTEAQLAARFGVNRHTVRRALADLAEQGLVRSRRGLGVFVVGPPTDYSIGRRVRFHQNVMAKGLTPAREILSISTQTAGAKAAAALQIAADALVHVYDGLAFVENAPIAVFQSTFPAERFPMLPDALRRSVSTTKALAECGIEDYTRASTRVTAKLATPIQALHLQIDAGDPILQSASVNVDPDGAPIEFGLTWFSGDRVGDHLQSRVTPVGGSVAVAGIALLEQADEARPFGRAVVIIVLRRRHLVLIARDLLRDP